MSLGRTAQNSTCGFVRAWGLHAQGLKLWHALKVGRLPSCGATRWPHFDTQPCLAVQVIDDTHVVRVWRQQQPQQPQHQPLAAAAPRVCTVRTIDA